MRLHRAPARTRCPGARAARRDEGSQLSDSPRRGRRPRRRRGRGRGDPAPGGPRRSAAMLRRARPLPGPDPRRPVALAPDRRPARRHRPPSPPWLGAGDRGRGPRRRLPPLADPPAPGDRRRPPLPRPPPRRRRHREPPRPPLPGDRRRGAGDGAQGLGGWPAGSPAGGVGGSGGRALARSSPCPRAGPAGRRPHLWLPTGSGRRSSSSTRCRLSTRPISRRASRTSASSSCRSPSSTRCCGTSSGTGGC